MSTKMTGVINSRLALGTVQFGLQYGIANDNGQVDLKESINILRCAESIGVNTLDTAIAYGESEKRLGQIGVDGWQVITKLPLMPDHELDPERVVFSAVEGSLERLRVSNLYGLLLHDSNDLLGTHGAAIYRALVQLKSQGLVEKIGVSIYSPAELDTIWRDYQFDLVQAPFNIFDRRLGTSGWLSNLKSEGVEVHVRSIFLQGLLLMPVETRPQAFNRWNSLWNEWDSWLENNRLQPLEACLSFLNLYPDIDKIVVGVNSLKQMQEIGTCSSNDLVDFPAVFECHDLDLITPSHWKNL